MRRFFLWGVTLVAMFIIGCGMQRPSRPITPLPSNATPTVASPLSTPTRAPASPTRPATGPGPIMPFVTATAVITRTGTTGPISPLLTPVVATSRTAVPGPTWTPLPTSTGTPRPGSPPGGPPPPPTSTPKSSAPPAAPTPTPPPFPFVVENSFGSPDCSKTEINGTLLSKTRQGLGGYRVTVGNVNGQFATTTSPTGSDGKYSVVLYNVPTTGRWYVVVVDSSGKELSARVQVETSTANCGPGQSGIQIARVDFRKDY